jgi:putative flippase GtrA
MELPGEPLTGSRRNPRARGDRDCRQIVDAIVAERSQQLRFVAVGIWNTIFAYAIWASLQWLLGDRLHYLVILVLAWPIAVLNAYVCHRKLVFHSDDSIRRELPRFSMIYVVSLLASLVALPILLQVLPFNIYVVQAGFTITIVAASYLGHRSFSFAGRSSARRSPETHPPR